MIATLIFATATVIGAPKIPTVPEITAVPDSLTTTHNIEAVTVTSRNVTREADRFVLTVGNATSLTGLDGAELLKRAPGVWIADDRISINGAAGVKVFVDGRQLRGSTEEVVAYLRGLTSGDVSRVEVVPQSGVEFSADSRGGVILITLRRRRAAGMDGHVQAGTSQGSRLSSYAPRGRVGLHTGRRWTFDASGGGVLTPRNTGHSTEQRTGGVSGEADSRRESRSGQGHLTAIFDPDSRHTLGVDVEWLGADSENRTDDATTLREILSQAHSRHRTDRGTFTAGVNFIRRLDSLGSQIKVMADYTRHTTGGESLTASTTASTIAERDSTWRATTGSRYEIFTIDASLTRKFRRGVTFGAGVRYTDDRTRDNSLYEAPEQGVWQTLPSYSYDQHYREQIGAGYVSAAWNPGLWSLSAGLRAEYTSTRGADVRRSHLSLFPSLSVTRAFNETRSWMLAAQYGRNIERPSFAAMNPARIR